MNKRENNTIFMLFSAVKYSTSYYVLYIISFVILGVSTPILINVQKNIIDFAEKSNSTSMPYLFIFIYFVIFFMESFSQNIQQYFSFRILNNLEKVFYGDYIKKLSSFDFATYENEKSHDLFFRIESKMLPTLTLCINLIPNVLRRIIELGGILYFVIQAGVWWAFPISIIISIPSFYFNKKRIQYAREVWSRDNKNMRYAEYLNKILLNKESAKERKLFPLKCVILYIHLYILFYLPSLE